MHGQDGKLSLWNGNAGPQQRAPNSVLPLPGMNMRQVPELSIPTRQKTRMKDEAQRQIAATLEETQRRNEAHLKRVKSTGMTDFQRTMAKAAADSDKPPPKLPDIHQHTSVPFYHPEFAAKMIAATVEKKHKRRRMRRFERLR